VTGCEIYGNMAAKNGGGVNSESSHVLMTGSAIRGNQAKDEGGGICHCVESAELKMVGSDISGNQAPVGPNIYVDGDGDENSTLVCQDGDNKIDGGIAPTGSLTLPLLLS